jgi:TetR/AcrR family transcriptional repressor of mexJK operon
MDCNAMNEGDDQPTKPTGRPSAEAARQLQETILAAALAEFITRGFEGASMEGIARVAGVTKRTLYRRARDKQTLFVAVVERHASRSGALELAQIAGGALETRLKRASDVMLGWFLQPESLGLYRTIIAEAARRPDFGILADAPFRRATDAIAVMLAKDDQRDAGDIAFGAQMFLRMVTAEPLDKAVQGIEPPGMSPVKRARAHRAVEFFLAGWRNSLVAPDG